ncbi:MAG TPA: DUF4337 family protein [Solirubrobacterales bacterium]|nr:DUF4337 family protein [Solirubrobacterales bacterium]
MEAHRSYERFEEGHRVAAARDGHGEPHYGRNAALAVAVMAAFLALATFLSNEAVKEVVTGETHRADTSARLESNRVKIDIASGNAEIQADEDEADHANTQHLDYELAEVGLQVGIVLASVSIIARRRWLLACGGAVATAGVLLLAVGLLA